MIFANTIFSERTLLEYLSTHHVGVALLNGPSSVPPAVSFYYVEEYYPQGGDAYFAFRDAFARAVFMAALKERRERNCKGLALT